MSNGNGRATVSPPYTVIAIVVVGIGAVGGAVSILLTQGDKGLIAAGIITTFATTIISTLVGLQAKQTHDLVNSTASELRDVRSALSFKQGAQAGAEEGQTATRPLSGARPGETMGELDGKRVNKDTPGADQ